MKDLRPESIELDDLCLRRLIRDEDSLIWRQKFDIFSGDCCRGDPEKERAGERERERERRAYKVEVVVELAIRRRGS